MPVNPTYPGVYIQEIPSGVRSIVGVATSITAFIGRAPRGPVDDAVRISSFADYERRFGGLHEDSQMSYAVAHYYQNGGSDAIIVRIANDVGDAASVTLAAGSELLELQAVAAGPARHPNNHKVADK